jgi:hypothetical protein
LLLVMILTSRMNFMIIGHDLEVLWKKNVCAFFRHFSTPTFSDKKCQFKLKNWLLPYFCMRNPKKMVSRRSVDPPDSNLGGSCCNLLLSYIDWVLLHRKILKTLCFNLPDTIIRIFPTNFSIIF